jgi:two-component system KDP operon response regulator KdpE
LTPSQKEGPVKIIVADDDPQMLGALRIILRAHGDDPVVARNGKEALDAGTLT